MRSLMLALALGAALLPGCSGGPEANLSSPEPYERYLAALELTAGRPEDVKILQKLLEDPDPLARCGAVVAFGRIGRAEHSPLVVEMLFEKVEKDGQVRNTPLVRAEACRTLARIGDPKSLAPLGGVLRGDTSVEVRRTAALALERFMPAAGEALVAAVGDRDASVAHSAHAVLCRVSGRDFPREVKPWQDWLRAQTPKK